MMTMRNFEVVELLEQFNVRNIRNLVSQYIFEEYTTVLRSVVCAL
jgi:hypothetical protein